MAYNPAAYYSSRGAEYGATGVAGRAAGIGDVLKEKAKAKRQTETATDRLRKKGSWISGFQGLGNLISMAGKAAMLGAKGFKDIAALSSPLGVATMVAGARFLPSIFESMGVGAFKKIKTPEYSKKYDVYEPYEEAFEGARESVTGEMGLMPSLMEGGKTLMDLYMTKHTKGIMEKLGIGEVPGTDTASAFDPSSQDMSKQGMMSMFGASDTAELYDMLSQSTDIDFYSDIYETGTGATDWNKAFSDLSGQQLWKG